jgi:hypothetical protein
VIWAGEAAFDECVADVDTAFGQLDVLPAQCEQLTAAQRAAKRGERDHVREPPPQLLGLVGARFEFAVSGPEAGDLGLAEHLHLLHEDLKAEVPAPDDVTLAGNLGAVYEVLGMRREDLRDVVADTIFADSQALGLKTVEHARLPLPSGMDGEVLAASILDLEVGDVYYAWGEASATARATVEYTYSAGIYDDWELEELDPPEVDFQVDERNEDSHFVAVSGERRADVELTVALEPGAAELDLLQAEVIERDEFTNALRNELGRPPGRERPMPAPSSCYLLGGNDAASVEPQRKVALEHACTVSVGRYKIRRQL